MDWSPSGTSPYRDTLNQGFTEFGFLRPTVGIAMVPVPFRSIAVGLSNQRGRSE